MCLKKTPCLCLCCCGCTFKTSSKTSNPPIGPGTWWIEKGPIEIQDSEWALQSSDMKSTIILFVLAASASPCLFLCPFIHYCQFMHNCLRTPWDTTKPSQNALFHSQSKRQSRISNTLSDWRGRKNLDSVTDLERKSLAAGRFWHFVQI